MALKINNSLVIENIEDKDGNVLGQIKFDPKDEKIMKKLSDIIVDLQNSVKKFEDLGEIPDIREQKIENLEDFEKSSKDFEKLSKAIDIEYYAVENSIKAFEEIFGKETMDIITCGSVSLDNIIPLIDFIGPYIKENREQKIGKYTNGNSTIFK